MKIAALLSSQMIKGFSAGWYTKIPGSAIESTNGILVIPSSTPAVRFDEVFWNDFKNRMNDFDLIVAYLHHVNNQDVMDLLKHIPDEKIVFVMCACHSDFKMSIITSSGKRNSKVVLCKTNDHTGSDEMIQLARSFLYDDI